MLLKDISCVLLSYLTSYNILVMCIMNKWDNLLWSFTVRECEQVSLPHQLAEGGPLEALECVIVWLMVV